MGQTGGRSIYIFRNKQSLYLVALHLCGCAQNSKRARVVVFPAPVKPWIP